MERYELEDEEDEESILDGYAEYDSELCQQAAGAGTEPLADLRYQVAAQPSAAEVALRRKLMKIAAARLEDVSPW